MSVAAIYCTRAEAKAAIFEYIEVFDNRQRHHSGIGCKTPKQAFCRYDWENGRIRSVIKRSGNRGEVRDGVAEDGDAT